MEYDPKLPSAPSDAYIRDTADLALQDFWSRVAKRFPSIKTGDLSPEVVTTLQFAAESAIREWWQSNNPDLI